MKKVKMMAGLVPVATGLVFGAQAHAASQGDTRHAAKQAASLTGERCWTINAANIRIFQSPDKNPYFTTKKGQEFVTSGSPVSAGGKEWYYGYDAAYRSPPVGWIARNYLNKRKC